MALIPSAKHPRTQKLIRLMAKHNVDVTYVAKAMNRSLKTVYCWRAQSPAPISASMLELLELKLAAKSTEEA